MRVKSPYESLIGFRSEKSAQISAYFASKSNRGLEILKLAKLQYLTERESIKVRRRPMIFDEYYSLPHGPICSCAMNGLNGNFDKSIWRKYIAPRDNNIIRAALGLRPSDFDQVSQSDWAIVDAVWAKFGLMTPSQLRKWTHDNCSEYCLVEHGRMPIALSDLAKALNLDNPELIEEYVADYRRSEARLS